MHGLFISKIYRAQFYSARLLYFSEEKMFFDFTFFFNSILLGIGLAMDAFSVSLANGLNEPCMKKRKMTGVAGVFSLFQFATPMIGWICVHTVLQYFSAFEKFIPWIALLLLCYIGGKMLYEGITNDCECCEKKGVGLGALIVQGIATSIDALSVGFTISEYELLSAVISCLIIGVVTFFICLLGLYIGKTAGTRLSGKAGILGGSILIFIGLEIFIKSFL
jgi:putative Mn2+ efflux pump MntP